MENKKLNHIVQKMSQLDTQYKSKLSGSDKQADRESNDTFPIKSLALASAVKSDQEKIKRIINEEPIFFDFINIIESFPSNIFFNTYSKQETSDIWKALGSRQKEEVIQLCARKMYPGILKRLHEIESDLQVKDTITKTITELPPKPSLKK